MRFLTEILAKAGITSNYVQLDTLAATPGGAPGRIVWNDVDGTLEFQMKGGNVTQQIGQELPVLVKHADNTGLTNGKVVYQFSSDGSNVTVKYASASSEATASKTFGVMTEDATGGAKAFCTTFGYVRNINTSALTEGAMIWLSETPGEMTTTRPTQPAHGVVVGRCIRQHATEGVIFVSIQNGFELDELHDVLITSKANNDFIVYESATNLWKNKTISAVLGYTPANGANYLALTGGTLTGDLTLSGVNPRLYFTDTDNNPDYFISNTDGTFTVYDVTNSVGRFKIYSTGNAEFTGALSVGGNLSVNNGANTTVSLNGTAFVGIEYSRNSNIYGFVGTENSASGGMRYNSVNGNYEHNFYTNSSLSFKLSSTGAATFSSSVTATSGIFSGTSSEPLRVERIIAGTVYGKYSLAISGSGVFSVYDAVAAVDRFAITSSGNIGAGNTNPFGGASGINGMHITSLSANSAFFRINNASYTGFDLIQGNDGVGYLWLRDNQMIQIGTNNTERIRVTNAGRIIVNNSVANDSGDRNLTIQGSLSATNNDVASINLTQVWNGVSYPAILAVQQDLSYGNASGIFVLKTSYWNGSSVVTSERLRVAALGQLKLSAYTSSTSFSGTAAGYLAFDSSGNVITVAGVAATDNTKLPLAGGTMTGQLIIGTTGIANSPSVRINTSSSASFVHTQENFAANLTAGQRAMIFIGKEGSTKNAGGYGYYWAGAGSNSNFLTMGHWGNDDLLRIYGDGAVQTTGYLRTAGVTSNTVLFNAGASSVDFGNAFGQGTTNRSVYFRGNTGVSAWWGGVDVNGANIPFAAIDATAGEFTFWRNTAGTGGGSWTKVMTMNSSGLYMNEGTVSIGGNNVIHGGNIGSQSVNYAAYSGYAPLLSALGDYVFDATTNGRSFNRGIQTSFVSASQSYPSFGSVVRIRTYTGVEDGGTAELYFPYNSTYGGSSMRYRMGQYANAGWTGWKTVIDSDNYSSYSVPISGGVNMTGSFGLNDTKLYLRTNGDNNHYLWNAADDWEELVAYNGTGFRISTSTGTALAYFSSSYINMPQAPAGATLTLGGVDNARTYNDTNRQSLVINAPYYPHLYVNATTYNGNTNHGAVISMTGVLSAGGYRRWGMGIANTDPTALSWGCWDNQSNPHYGVGGTLGYTDTGAKMWLNNSGVLQVTGSMRAPTFYDSEDTGYYLDPNTTGTSGRFRGEIFLGPNTSGRYTRLGGNGGNTDEATVSASNGNLHIDCKGGYGLYLNYYSTNTIYLGNNGYTIAGNGSYYNGRAAVADNANSISSAVGSLYNWTGIQYFVSNRNTSSDSPPLQAYSNNGSGAIMSFHRGGYYAVNFGLDSDNVMRIGGWSAGANRWQLDMSGNQTVAGNVTASSDVYSNNGWFYSNNNAGWYNNTYGQGLRQSKANVSYGNVITVGENYNGWSGYNTTNTYVTCFMQNSAGTHGFYQEGGGDGWTLFYNFGYKCWGMGTDATDPSYSLHIPKYGGSNTGWIIWSDRRIKENIKTIDSALDKVLSLRGVYYNKIDDPNKERQVGYIAQEVLEIVPELVVYSEELDIYNMNYAPMVSMLTEATKEHYAKTLAQQAEIDALKEQVQTLLNHINNGV